MKEYENQFNITFMCKVLGVNRSAYYHWIKNGCIVNKVDVQLNQLIKDIFYQYREVYGTRRIKEVLVQEYGIIVFNQIDYNVILIQTWLMKFM